MSFVRFVVSQVDSESTVRSGVFQAFYALRDTGRLTDEEAVQVKVAMKWLNENLAGPTRFARKRNRSHVATRGISRFKDTAKEHLRQIREVVKVLEAHGIVVEMLRTARPGYVLYEDDHQVVAEPFSETPR